MKVLHAWLQEYFEESLPSAGELVRPLTMHAYEIEGVEGQDDDAVIDVDVLPNRSSDSFSHRGIARELSTILDRPLKHDPYKEVPNLSPESSLLSVSITDEQLCRRYSAAVIRGVKVGPSPDWLKKRLEALGQKSINNIVDATNYVMFDLGQPLHAFDAGKLQEKAGLRIGVRPAKAGEKIATLDGGAYELTPEHLVIADGNSGAVLGIAGVKGGVAAEIGTDTTDIILESANFHPTNIRKTSQALKLRTDASARFENEPPVELTGIALARAATLIQELSGGTLEGYTDIYPRPRGSLYLLGVSLDEVNRLLGININEDELESILNRLGFAHERVEPLERVLETAKKYEGTPYKYGASVSYDAPKAFDCSSFTAYCFARAGISIPRIAVDQFVYGDQVEKSELKPGDLVFSKSDSAGARSATVEFMSGTPVGEGISHCGIYLGDGAVIHAAGSGEEGSVVIESLEHSKYFAHIVGCRRIVEAGERFVATIPLERLDLRLPVDLIEEVGRTYGYEKIDATPLPEPPERPVINKRFHYAERVRDILLARGFSEIYTHSLVEEGSVELQNALASDKSALRPDLRKSMERTLELNGRYADLLGLDEVRLFELGTTFPHGYDHSALSIGILIPKGKGREVKADAVLKTILTVLGDGLGLSVEADIKGGIAEIDFDHLVAQAPDPQSHDVERYEPRTEAFHAISPYPFVLRDIAVWVPSGVTTDDLLQKIKNEAGELLVSAKLFDEYEKDGFTSYAYRLVFQSYEKTLSDDEVNVVMEGVQKAVEKSGWEVR